MKIFRFNWLYIAVLMVASCSGIKEYPVRYDIQHANPKQLAVYVKSERDETRKMVAQSENTPPEILAQLSEDINAGVMFALARNPHTPPEVLDRLSGVSNPNIATGAIENPSLPASAMKKLAWSDDRYTRQLIAGHPNLPLQLRIKLAFDENEYVESVATDMLNTDLAFMDRETFPKIIDTPMACGVVVLSEPGTMINTRRLKHGLYMATAEFGSYNIFAIRKGFKALSEKFELKPSQTFVHRFDFQPEPVERERNIDLGNGVSMHLVWCPPGNFMMGTENEMLFTVVDSVQIHRVALTKGFWMGSTEVTQAQYQAIMGINPSHTKGKNYPVQNVNYFEALDFCSKLGNKLGLECQLPTEAQWEYGCRAGLSYDVPIPGAEDLGWFERIDLILQYANCRKEFSYYECSGNTNKELLPVASLKPNEWGLYDMCGNVSEWCLDQNQPHTGKKVVNPFFYSRKKAEQERGGYYVVKGGGVADPIEGCLPPARGALHAIKSHRSIGFRVVVY